MCAGLYRMRWQFATRFDDTAKVGIVRIDGKDLDGSIHVKEDPFVFYFNRFHSFIRVRVTNFCTDSYPDASLANEYHHSDGSRADASISNSHAISRFVYT